VLCLKRQVCHKHHVTPLRKNSILSKNMPNTRLDIQEIEVWEFCPWRQSSYVCQSTVFRKSRIFFFPFGNSSSVGTTTLGWVLLNCHWAFSARRFHRLPLPAARQTPNLEENQGFRAFQLSPQELLSVWRDASESFWELVMIFVLRAVISQTLTSYKKRGSQSLLYHTSICSMSWP
jgi:hypothetical protein